MFGILDPICSINLNDLPKDAFHVEVASCKNPVSKHLPEKVVRACTEGLHTPINPHAQRLLTAEARSTGRVPRGEPKKSATPKSRAKGQKPKGAKRQDATSAGVEVGKKRAKQRRKSRKLQVFLALNMLPPRKSSWWWTSCSFLLGVLLYWGTLSSIHPFLRSWPLNRLLRLEGYTQKVKEQWWLSSNHPWSEGYVFLPSACFGMSIKCQERLGVGFLARWRDSDKFKQLIAEMGQSEAKRRRYIWRAGRRVD